MKILCDNIDKKKHFGSLDLIPESSDDIYEISKIIKPEDKIKCFTHRKLTIDGKNQQKIGLYLKIKVESFNVDLENGILYAKGRVCEENEYVKIGSYHTLDVELDKKFNIYKDSWNFYDIQLIKNCTNGSQDVLFYIFYEKCCVICLVGKNNIKIINKIEIKFLQFNRDKNRLYKKMSKNQKINLKDFFLKLFFLEFDKGNLDLLIGKNKIRESLEFGALEKIFFIDEIYKPNEIEKRKKWNFFVKILKITVLKEFGGVAGILKFIYN
ncbi:protein pelota [Vairimorpha apis BRL 01]|uniref:Protein pelota n=1 Tax=Vairimorpha apis BRL 01 TaxID=1037528 RepID=T0MHK6_9MICR|nr:protein pelota [Vairimorpha apis BRL 01]